jgi:hypothetical protein
LSKGPALSVSKDPALSLSKGPVLSVSKERFEVSLATAADEAEVRRLLREHPLAGDVVVSLEREPDSRIAAGIEGDVHHTLVARERTTSRIAAIASRAVRDAFVNGVPARVGYLGQLRIAEGVRGYRTLLDSGFDFCRELHEAGDARVYLTSIVADNQAARRLLLGLRSRSAPRFEPAGALSTLILPRARRRVPRRHGGIEIRPGSRDLLEEIAACLWRNGERRQFAPCWRLEDLCAPRRTPDLSPEHFLVATRGGRVVGCVARWDQRRFKQVFVRGFSPRLRRWRPIVNLAGRWLGLPRLPEVGSRLEFAYLSHFAVDGDDVATATALVAAARSSLPPDVDYVVLGLAEGSSLLPALRRRSRHREYRSLLYLACWPDGERVVRALDGRLPHAEVAVL